MEMWISSGQGACRVVDQRLGQATLPSPGYIVQHFYSLSCCPPLSLPPYFSLAAKFLELGNDETKFIKLVSKVKVNTYD